MPNLFSALPVAILAWVLASMSGLTRTEMLAVRPFAGRDRGQQFELRLRLDVDAEDALVDRERELARGLADAGEHDLVGRDAGGAGALELALGDDVGAGAEPRQGLDHGLVGIRLHRVADERRHVGEGAGEHPVVPLERRGRIAIERRADRAAQVDEIDRLGVQHAVAIVEMVHGGLRCALSRSAQSSGRRCVSAHGSAADVLAVRARLWGPAARRDCRVGEPPPAADRARPCARSRPGRAPRRARRRRQCAAACGLNGSRNRSPVTQHLADWTSNRRDLWRQILTAPSTSAAN